MCLCHEKIGPRPYGDSIAQEKPAHLCKLTASCAGWYGATLSAYGNTKLLCDFLADKRLQVAQAENTIRIANSLDPDETPRSVASHRDPNLLEPNFEVFANSLDPDETPQNVAERTLIKVLVLAPDPKNAGFIAYRASAQTGARTRTPIACEASSHFGTRTREMLLTKLVLISAAGRLEGECSVWASTQTGARTRDRSLLVQILTSEFEPSLIGRKQGKCSDRDSIPGSIAYRDSAQIGAQYYAYTDLGKQRGPDETLHDAASHLGLLCLLKGISRYEELSARWDQAKQEVRHEDHELLRAKVTLQQELIRRQDEYAQQLRALQTSQEAEKRQADKARKQAKQEELLQICKQSLVSDKKKEKGERSKLKQTTRTSSSSADDVFLTSTPNSLPSSPVKSPTKSPTTPPTPGGRRSNPFRMTLPAVAPTPDIGNDEGDDEEGMDAFPDDVPWHEQQLYRLYGRNADYFLHPKLDNTPEVAKRNNSKLRRHGGRAGAEVLWQTLRQDSSQRLLKEDASIPARLKEAYGSFARQSLRRNRLPVRRMFCVEDDLPEMPRLLDNSKLQHVRRMRHKIDLMYRASVSNKDRTDVLKFNNPLPELHTGATGVDQYLPSWQDQDSESTEPEYLRWLRPQPVHGQDDLIEEEQEEKGELGLPRKPQVTQSLDDNLMFFMQRKKHPQPKQKYLFLSEKDTRVKGSFSEKYKGDRENKNIPRPYKGSLQKSYSALGGMIAESPEHDKSDSTLRYSAPLPYRRVGLQDYTSSWEPLSMHALVEYKKQMSTLGDGDFNLGRAKMWASIPVV
ncbi:hypothetical protein DPMN_179223 [Dreissena polymorpha]|uniref:Uncharacterized protein n=1 Tax=Dreissena polymorpha TaxID=45954 RepID=A0A9D4EE59_DREPO|nr:hypothetical protein DPMN_179223 [Dreissena polymorpha]